MALELFTKSEKEILSSAAKTSNASSITLGHFVPEDDDMFIIDSQMSSSYCRGCATSLHEDSTSASEAGDDPCSVYSPLLDSECSDDEHVSTPRSLDINAGSCVYSVMFLLAALPKCSSSTSSVLGYRSEVVPDDVERFPTASDRTYKASKAAKATKTKSKQAPKGRSQSFEEISFRPSLPTDSSESWVAQQRTKASIDEDAKVIRAARSILNKLTLEKFDNLFSQLVACGIDTPSHLSTLMHEIFEKATMQHKFIPMYAELCVRLETDPQIMSVVGGSDVHSFRRLLLNQCQQVFEQLLEPNVAGSFDAAAAEVGAEAKMLRKQQALGNIKLIAELIVKGMLSSNLFVDCGNKLLHSRASCPEALESLAALVMVAGPKFDNKDWQHHAELKALFAGMTELTKDKSTPPRVRFLLRDVLDARSAGWCTSVNQAALKIAPMKLDEVREKAAAEGQAIASVTSPKAPIVSSTGLQRLTAICKQPWAVNAARMEDKYVEELGILESSQKQSKSNSSGLSRLADICRQPVAESACTEEVVSVRTPLALKPKKQKCKTPVVQVAEARPVGLQCSSQKVSEQQTSCEEAPAKSPIFEDVAVPMPHQTIEASAASGSVFDLVSFRRELSATLTKLASEKNAPAAVQYMRLQEVPVDFQADQFVDILSRVVEERRGAVRRCQFAFAAGLMQGDLSPFEQSECFNGIALFFKDVYVEMCGEIPRLPAILKSEFVPTLRNVFPSDELNAILPEEMRA